MISLGGTIGTGLFLASGASVANAGPGGALIAYALVGLMVFFMMECLGEMVRKKKSSLKGHTELIFFFCRLLTFPFQAVSTIMLVGLLTLL